MSRSNPGDNVPNPSTRWHEWHGSSDGGAVRYYDKEAKSNIIAPLPFTFIVLDELARVSGWHEPSESGIFSNEVRDTRQDTMVVRSFKGGELATGLYASIRDRVAAIGGHFEASIYIAYRDSDGPLRIGNIAFKGAALNAWVEFRRANRAEIYKQAIAITGYTEGKKGSIVYRVPTFKMRALGDVSNAEAIALDADLQAYLKTYLSRTREDQVRQAAETVASETPVPAGREAMEGRMAREADARQATQDFYAGATQAEPRSGAGGFIEDSEIPFAPLMKRALWV